MSGHEGESGHSGESRGLDRGIDSLERKRQAKEPARIAGTLRGQRVRLGTEKLLTRTTSGIIYAIVALAAVWCISFLFRSNSIVNDK